MARVVVAGAGAIGASIAYHLALRGADDVVLADVGEIAGGATGKAMGGVRQQFTTEAEVRLAQASVRLFRELGAPLFEQVGYLFLATTETGLAELEERRAVQAELGVPVERVDAGEVDGLRTDDVLGATICREDGIADPAGVTRELVRRAAALGVDVRERTDALSLAAETLVVACGARSPAVAAARGVELPIRPLVRQLADVGPVEAVPAGLPMTIEENGFHFRRVGTDGLRLAMGEPRAALGRPRGGRRRAGRGLAGAPGVPLPARGRSAAAPRVGRLLRHDARCAPDHRRRRRRSLRRVRLFGPRLHAVPGSGGRRRRGAPRRLAALRAGAVPARPLRRRRDLPRDPRAVDA